jgi:hypothetical protein
MIAHDQRKLVFESALQMRMQMNPNPLVSLQIKTQKKTQKARLDLNSYSVIRGGTLQRQLW